MMARHPLTPPIATPAASPTRPPAWSLTRAEAISPTRLAAFSLTLAAALSPALTPAASAQETSNEIYGSFRYSFNRVSLDGLTQLSAVNNASRVGLRGWVGEGLQLFYHLEAGAVVDGEGPERAFTPRFYMAGVRGAFGTVTAGRTSPEYKLAGLRLDPFYDSSTLGVSAQAPTTGLFAGATYGLSRLTNGWAERTLQYTTPTHRGLSGNLAFHADPDDDHDFGFGVRFQESRLDAGFQYRSEMSEGGNWTAASGIDDALRLHALYGIGGAWSLGVSAERLRPAFGESQQLLYVSGTLRPRERTLVAASVGSAGSGDAGHPRGTGVNLQVAYDLFPLNRVNATWSWVDLADAGSRSVISAGVTLNFSGAF